MKGKRLASTLVVALFAAAAIPTALSVGGCATDGPATEGEMPEEAAEGAYGFGWQVEQEEDQPRIITLDNGTQLQRVPSGMGNSGFLFGGTYNNVVLNADERGCAACHDDIHQLILDHGHELGYSSRYPARLTDFSIHDCVACHSDWYTGGAMKNGMHTLHLSNTKFTEMGGNCESCHYIQDDGTFVRWDDVKYDVMHGYIDMDADTAPAEITWNQDEIIPAEHMVITDAPEISKYPVDQLRTPDWRDTFKITFSGEIGNPCEMSVNEMIERFGSETRRLAGQCIVNGTGGPLVQQVEMTGIPLRNIVEYLGIDPAAQYIYPIGLDGYCYPTTIEGALQNDPLLVYEINGEEMEDEYFPVYYFAENETINNTARGLGEICFTTEPSLQTSDYFTAYYEGEEYVYGDFTDTEGTGKLINRPNMGVLSAQDTQIFPASETTHLEGYALAAAEPIVRLEFSFDHGQTWKVIETPNTVPESWVYWKMDLPGLEEGSYLIEMRAVSIKADGTERVQEQPTQFTFTLRS